MLQSSPRDHLWPRLAPKAQGTRKHLIKAVVGGDGREASRTVLCTQEGTTMITLAGLGRAPSSEASTPSTNYSLEAPNIQKLTCNGGFLRTDWRGGC